MTASTIATALPPAELPSELVFPLTDNETLIAWSAELMRRDPEEVRQLLAREERQLSAYHLWEFERAGVRPHVWSEELVNYYRRSDAGPLGFGPWNRRPFKAAMRRWIGSRLRQSNRSLRILVYGDGGGFDSAYFAMCGHDVTYYEVGEMSVEFARKVFSANELSVTIADDTCQLDGDPFDVVVCLDVLEHVPDPPQTVREFAGYLREGGELIVHAPFFFVDRHNPTHLASSKKYSGDCRRLYRRAGLEPIAGNLFWDPIVLQKRVEPGTRLRRTTKDYWKLKIGGWLLSVARVWDWPHRRVANYLSSSGDARWLEGLPENWGDLDQLAARVPER
ncbi:MAG: methyltransferase domain-containing protein [Pirellulaceae bacterium]